MLDFFPRPANPESLQVTLDRAHNSQRHIQDPNHALKKWLVRRVECIRGDVDIDIEVFPAFNYARDEHTVEIKKRGVNDTDAHETVVFKTKSISLQLSATIDCGEAPQESCPVLSFEKKSVQSSSLGEAVTARVSLKEGQGISFVLRDVEDVNVDECISTAMVDKVQRDTSIFWFNWISKSQYKGRWREIIARSLMILKLVCCA